MLNAGRGFIEVVSGNVPEQNAEDGVHAIQTLNWFTKSRVVNALAAFSMFIIGQNVIASGGSNFNLCSSIFQLKESKGSGEIQVGELISSNEFDLAKLDYFEGRTTSAEALLNATARNWQASGVAFESIQTHILDWDVDALRVLPLKNGHILNELAFELASNGIPNLVYSPKFMLLRNSNGAFWGDGGFLILPHLSASRPSLFNFILKHEYRHFEIGRLSSIGRAPLAAGWVSAKDGVDIWSSFKSLGGRYKKAVMGDEIDTYTRTYSDSLAELYQGWSQFSVSDRKERIAFLRDRVVEGMELARRDIYIYQDLRLHSKEALKGNQTELIYKTSESTNAEVNSEPNRDPHSKGKARQISVQIEGSTFNYEATMPSSTDEGHSVWKLMNKLPLSKSETANIISLNRTVDLKFKLLTNLASRLLERGPRILSAIDQVLLNNPEVVENPFPPASLPRLQLEVEAAKKLLDSANSQFERRTDTARKALTW